MQRFIYLRRGGRAWLALLLVVMLAACEMGDSQPVAEIEEPTATARPIGGLPRPTTAPQPMTIPSDDLLASALRHRALGNYDLAAEELYALLSAHPDAPEARAATFYLAESFALRQRWTSAAEALSNFLADGPEDTLYAQALFWLGRCHEEAGAHADAVAAFERYRAMGAPAGPYAQMRTAAQLYALGQRDQAAAAYETIAASGIAPSERAGAYEKAITLRYELGQADVALQLYHDLLALAESPAYRARVLAGGAALALEVGAVDQARAWLREIAERTPDTAQALQAVTRLVADPQGGLAPETAARVYDFHGQHTTALPFFDAAIAVASGEAALELRRARAVALRSSGDFAGAMAALAAVGNEAPNSEPGRQALLDWVQTLGQSGDIHGAINGYREFAQAYPDDPRAPEALSRAATLLLRLEDAEGTAQQRLDLGRRYPESAHAHDGLYQAGWYFYNAGRMDEAVNAWSMIPQGARGSVAARGAFWAARAAGSQSDEAKRLLQLIINIAPSSYYGARAVEMLGLELPQGVPIGTPIITAEWSEAEQWVASWAEPAQAVEQDGFSAVAESDAVQRAFALSDLSLHREATIEWNAARDRWRNEPFKLYAIARLAHEREIPYIALKATEQLLAMAPAEALPAPVALQRMRFPTPYSDIVLEQAREFRIDPRAVYAMMRQESLFNPGATSWVGARGLAQVMPATGQGIAQNLGVEGFQEADLYRPAVSIRFGTFYLSRQLTMMNGSLQAALSAYNGGPGNAQRWANGTVVADPDLFAESIDYGETREYVKLVYGYYGAYQRLYSWTQD